MFQPAFNREFKVPIGKTMYILRVEIRPNNTLFFAKENNMMPKIKSLTE